MCCQVDVSATSWSLVQRSPTDCDASLYVIKKPRARGHSPRWAAVPGMMMMMMIIIIICKYVCCNLQKTHCLSLTKKPDQAVMFREMVYLYFCKHVDIFSGNKNKIYNFLKVTAGWRLEQAFWIKGVQTLFSATKKKKKQCPYYQYWFYCHRRYSITFVQLLCASRIKHFTKLVGGRSLSTVGMNLSISQQCVVVAVIFCETSALVWNTLRFLAELHWEYK
jgi:hypothetical protein